MKWINLMALVYSFTITGQECSTYWRYLLDTDVTHPKALSGDTNAAYGVLSFIGDESKRFVVKGKFPQARFMSLESAKGRHQYRVDAIMDFQIQADEGSQNPFKEAVPIESPNVFFTVEMVPEGIQTTAKNVIRTPLNHDIHSLMFRIYSPRNGVTVTTADLPKVYAFDVKTGEPASCSKYAEVPFYFKFPQFVSFIIPPKSRYAFKEMNIKWGGNIAIPTYTYGASQMSKGSEVSVIRFKAPSYNKSLLEGNIFQVQGDTRYWSFCAQNFPKNETLACLSDFMIKTDKDGFAPMVYGFGNQVKKRSEELGFNFIEDTRGPRQTMAGFAYRNLLPAPGFRETIMYKGVYLPVVAQCPTNEFMAGNCNP